jgi:hypothetical protein
VVLRRSLALFVATVVMMVMMAVSRVGRKPGGMCIAVERPTRSSENPRLRSEHSAIAGSKIIPCFRTNPKAPILVRRARRKRVLENDVSHQAGRGLPVVC